METLYLLTFQPIFLRHFSESLTNYRESDRFRDLNVSKIVGKWQDSHVPKFGNWDSNNIPYTIYFDNAVARNKKALVNPNDPEENPEAFNRYIRGVEKTSDEAVKGSTRTRSYSTSSLEQISHDQGNSNTKSHSHHTAESGNKTSNSDYSVIRRVKSSLKESMSVGATFIGSFSSSNHIKSKGGSQSLDEHAV